MKLKLAIIFVVMSLLVFVNSGLVLAQGEEATQEAPQAKSYLDTQWRWGEVVSTDVVNKTLTIKYLDFETDQEKELSVVVDASTVYENVAALEEIQPKDILSVDFLVTDSLNIAKNISIEKPESLPPVVQQVISEGAQSSVPVENITGPQVASVQTEALPVADQPKEAVAASQGN